MPRTSVGQNSGTFNADIITCLNLFINGQSLSEILANLNIEDQLEQEEIDEIRAFLARIDITNLTGNWIVNDLNRNAILKSRIDANDISIGTLDGKTRYISSVQGNNTAPKVASDFQVSIDDRDKRNIYLTTGTNFISSINDSTNQSNPGNYSDNQITLSAANGMITTTSHLNRIQASDTIEITGVGGMGIQSSPNIKLGNKGAQILIGSEDTPQIGQTNTVIKIGKRDTRNTETQIRGNVLLADARFTDLTVSSALTWNNLLSLIQVNSMPAWIASSILTSIIPNYVYSDLWSMAGSAIKNGDVETTTTAKLKGITIYDPTVDITIFPKVQTFLATGDISQSVLQGSIRSQTFNGEILLRNNNITSTAINWAVTEAGDTCNYFKISNNDMEMALAGGSNNSQMRITNAATGGKIRFRMGDSGLQNTCHDALAIFNDQATSQILVSNSNAPSGYDTTSKMLLDHNQMTHGLKVTNGSNALVTRVNHNNVNTPSITLQSNWNGSTSKSLYLNSNDELMYNGQKVNFGGGTSGGITYIIPLANNISPPANPPTELTMTPTYSTQPQRTITQAIAANTAYYIADYVTEVMNAVANPILTGVQQLNQYVRWNGNQLGQIYGRLWYQATAPINNILYNKVYSSPVTTSYSSILNGTPIPTPTGLYNVVFPRVVFTGIDIQPTVGQTAQLTCSLEALVNNVWTILTTINGQTFNSNTLNQTLTFQASPFSHDQTTATPNFHSQIRMSLSCQNGTIRQTTAGGATDLCSYRLEASASTAAFIRVNLFDGTNVRETIAQSATPILIEYDFPIGTPYDISAFSYSTLSTDVYFIQPSGGFAGHNIILYFNEGTISHLHTTIENPSVKEITAGTNISVINNANNYTIANAAPVQNLVAGSNISISLAGTTATINSTVSGGGSTNVTDLSITAAGAAAPFRKPSWHAQTFTGDPQSSPFVLGLFDSYSTITGNIIVYATRNNAQQASPLLYSSDFGTNYAQASSVSREWATVCGTLVGNRIWGVCNRTAGSVALNQIFTIFNGNFSLLTQVTAPSEFAANNLMIIQIRCSYDGQYLLMTEASSPNTNLGRIFKSSNYGTSWTTVNLSANLGQTLGCAVSGSGQYQFVCVDGTSGGVRADTGSGGVYRSSDFGSTWSRVSLPLGGQIKRVCCDGTGRYVMFADIASARVSRDYGSNYEDTTIGNTRSCAISDNGQYMMFGSSNGNIFLSRNYGMTFAQVNQTPSNFPYVSWDTCTMNNDASVITVGNISNFRQAQCREIATEHRQIYSLSGGLIAQADGGGGMALSLSPDKRGFRYYNGGTAWPKINFNVGAAINLVNKKIRGTLTANFVAGNVDYPLLIFNNLHVFPSSSASNTTGETSVIYFLASDNPMVSSLKTIECLVQTNQNISRIASALDGYSSGSYMQVNFEITYIINRGQTILRQLVCNGNSIISSKPIGTAPWQHVHSTFCRTCDLGGSSSLTHIGLSTYTAFSGTSGIREMSMDIEVIDLPTSFTLQTTS